MLGLTANRAFMPLRGMASTPRTDDVVEVERLRNGGGESELTIKQIELVPDGLLLWPRSTNARWSQPLELHDGAGEGEDIEVRIRGLLIGLHRRFG